MVVLGCIMMLRGRNYARQYRRLRAQGGTRALAIAAATWDLAGFGLLIGPVFPTAAGMFLVLAAGVGVVGIVAAVTVMVRGHQ